MFILVLQTGVRPICLFLLCSFVVTIVVTFVIIFLFIVMSIVTIKILPKIKAPKISAFNA